MARHAVMLLREQFQKGSHLCVELNFVLDRIPDRGRYSRPRDALFHHGRSVIEKAMETPGVAAFLLDPACYEWASVDREFREDGTQALCDLIEYIRERYPEVLVILDGVRANVHVDAATLSLYWGTDMVGPFVRDPSMMAFVRCRTMNTFAEQLQSWRNADGMPLYGEVARLAAEEWNDHGNVGITMQGATPATFDELYNVRNIVGPHMPILISGARADTLTMAVRGAGKNFLIVTGSTFGLQGIDERIRQIIGD